MNERFFELKKKRQDQIINGAMRIFAENGYRHASTDEMVAAAGISKGLLFHYFKSKKGTWLFLYEYSTRYTLLEMREAQRAQGADFFEMYRHLVRSDTAVLKKYPWMPLFLKRADREFDLVKAGPDDLSPDLRLAAASLRRTLLDQAPRPLFLSGEDSDRIASMLEYTRFGLMQELLPSDSPEKKEADDLRDSGRSAGSPAEDPFDLYAKRMTDYLWTLRKMNV